MINHTQQLAINKIIQGYTCLTTSQTKFSQGELTLIIRSQQTNRVIGIYDIR